MRVLSSGLKGVAGLGFRVRVWGFGFRVRVEGKGFLKNGSQS